MDVEIGRSRVSYSVNPKSPNPTNNNADIISNLLCYDKSVHKISTFVSGWIFSCIGVSYVGWF